MTDTSPAGHQLTADNRSGYLLFVEFQDGYAFRNMIEYLKASGNKAGSFVFTRQGITYKMANQKRTVVNCVQIFGHLLSCYVYNAKEPQISVGLTLAMFRTNTKSIGKRDGAQLFMLPNDPNLYIRQLSATVKGTSENLGFIRPQHGDDFTFDFEIDDYTRGEDNPNCTIPTSDFSKMAASMTSIHCKSVIFKGMSKGVICQGMLQGAVVGRVTHFGICETGTNEQQTNKAPKLWIMRDEEIGETINIRVDEDIVKALAKLNNMSTSGIVRVYMETGMPMLLLCNISNYGFLRIYLEGPDGK